MGVKQLVSNHFKVWKLHSSVQQFKRCQSSLDSFQFKCELSFILSGYINATPFDIYHFVTHSQVYPRFMGKVSFLAFYSVEQGCEDCSFLDDFEHGLDSDILWIASVLMTYII